MRSTGRWRFHFFWPDESIKQHQAKAAKKPLHE